ncbi:helicase [Trinickia terrae]|uniref:Helicase n=1 Tax=Trinickia terrae TaxID=2571161 RepID=A0A4U1I1B0_9BURK|nr:helicase [Trinickia terrae]TKC86947.1 helicase [Trinickia terrae]
MNSRVNGHNGHTNHQAEEAAQDAHTGQTQESRSFTRIKVQHTKMQRAKMLHNKMMAASWRNKMILAKDSKVPLSSAQKLLAKFGLRPRPEGYGKRGKEAAAHERPEDGLHAQDSKNEHEHKHNEEQQKQGQEHKREHEHKHEHEHEHDQQNQGQQHKREREKDEEKNQGQQHKHEKDGERKQDQQQNQGQNGGQPQQQGPRDGQPRRENREREKSGRSYAVKPGKIKAVRRQALASPMQLLAKEKLGAPDLPDSLASACTKTALQLMSQIERDGPLLLFPYLLSMASPLRMVRSRQPARLLSHHNAALAYGPSVSSKALVTAKLHGLSLDNTLARQSAGIEYPDDDQLGALIKQRILDALGGAPATLGGGSTAPNAAAKSAPVASDTTLEVRMPPAAPGTKT